MFVEFIILVIVFVILPEDKPKKLFTVFGTVSLNNVISIWPICLPSIATCIRTFGCSFANISGYFSNRKKRMNLIVSEGSKNWYYLVIYLWNFTLIKTSTLIVDTIVITIQINDHIELWLIFYFIQAGNIPTYT